MIRRARLDTSFRARVVSRTPLRYRAGADARDDRPAHVRAGSALVWHAGRLGVVQDDASFVAFVDVASGEVDVVALPRGDDGRRVFGDDLGNKRFKLDLEACIAFRDDEGEPTLMAFGSGSDARHARDNIVVVRGAAPTEADVQVIAAPRFYDRLRALTAFSGSELNVEGAALKGDHLTFFQRGNGAPRGPISPVNATCTVSLAAFRAFLLEPSLLEAPEPAAICQYDLGAMGGCPFGFTDGTHAGEHLYYLAAAESSPDAATDGPVAGCALGRLGEDSYYAHIEGSDGAPLRDKLEGLAPSLHDSNRFYGVVDRDDPNTPSELVELEVTWAV